jgi:hypothetical protein
MKSSVLTAVLLGTGAVVVGAAAPAHAGVLAEGLRPVHSADHSSLVGSVISGADQAVENNVLGPGELNGAALRP